MNRIGYISVFSAAMLLLVAVVESVASMFTGGSSPLFWVAPLYFWLLYAVAILFFSKKGNMVQAFMVFKGVKMFATMVIAFALAFVLRSSAKELMVYFLLYYIIMLVAESAILMYIRKCNK